MTLRLAEITPDAMEDPPHGVISARIRVVDSSRFVGMKTVLDLIRESAALREQQKILEYLREENRVLKEQLGGRLLLTPASPS